MNICGQDPEHDADEDHVEGVAPEQANDHTERDWQQEGAEQDKGKGSVVLMGDLVRPNDLPKPAHILRIVAGLLACLFCLLGSLGLSFDVFGCSLRVLGAAPSVSGRRVSHCYSLSGLDSVLLLF